MSRVWLLLVVGLMFACHSPTGPSPVSPFVVINEVGQLDQELDLFVDTDRQLRTWVSNLPDSLQGAYPSGQQWGFFGAVLKGSSAPGSRPGRNMSGFKKLQIDLRGLTGGETVQIGVKDNRDPDDGTETRKTETLSTSWQTFTYSLADFRTADLTRLYLLVEVVFNGAPGRTVQARNVRYVP